MESVPLLQAILQIQHQVQGKAAGIKFAERTQTQSGQFNGSSLAEAKLNQFEGRNMDINFSRLK